MRHLCFKSSVFIFIFNFLYGFNLGFYYDYKVPDEFNLYDLVVVQNDIKKVRKNYIAYVSIGEQYKPIKKWLLGKNKNWNSFVLDLRKREYQDYLLKKMKNLNKFQGFFFDTLDSYQLVLPKKSWKSYEEAEVAFIKRVKKLYPDKKIILNRGFEIIDRVKNDVFAVVAEGMFYGFNGKKFVEVPKEGREWLIAKLNHIKSLGIKVVVIDYFDGKDFKKAKEIAKKIEKVGFIPYVTNPELNILGVTDFDIVKRKILIINTSKYNLMDSDSHRLLQMPLEYMGYVADIKTPKEALKIKNVRELYSGVIIVSERSIKEKGFGNWLKRVIKNGNRAVFLEDFGIDNFSFLGVKTYDNRASIFDVVKVVKKDKSVIGFETSIPRQLPRILTYSDGGLLVIKNSKNQLFTPIAITKWGGYALSPFVFNDFGGDVKWVINPFLFFKRALHLKEFPKPDYTTENGMRVFFSHLDGDGSVSRAEFNPSKIACEVIKDEILKKYNLPFGISFIEAEIMPYGVYPKFAKRVMKCAKETYSLKNVEPASHTFSHPFFWKKDSKLEGKILPPKYNLPVKNYKFSIFREIVGSCKNLSKLSPKDKPVRLIFWSGDCNPPVKALKIAYENGILNMNGGDTTIRKNHNFISNIAPAGIKKGDYYQVYDGEQDEFIYTDGFTKNFWGYRNVVQTFKLTDKPRRFKPIDVYFHFYIGTKIGSLNSLKYVLNWCLKQDIIPFKVSDYIKKVLDYYGAVIAKKGDYWIVKTDKNLRTLKVPQSFGYPDLRKSKGVIGWYDYNNDRYLSLDGSGNYKIRFIHKIQGCRIIQSNGRVVSTHPFHLKSLLQNVKLRTNCKIKTNDKFIKKNGWLIFNKSDVRFNFE